eukprot:Opistho-2@18749
MVIAARSVCHVLPRHTDRGLLPQGVFGAHADTSVAPQTHMTMVATTPVQRFEPLKDDITALDRLMYACRKFFREKLLRRKDPPQHRSPPRVIKNARRRSSIGPEPPLSPTLTRAAAASPALVASASLPVVPVGVTSAFPRRSSIISLDGDEPRPTRITQRRASRVSFSDCVDVGETYDPKVYDRGSVKMEMTETDMLRIQAELFLFKMQEMEAVPSAFNDY